MSRERWIVVDLTARPGIAVLRGYRAFELAQQIGARPVHVGTVRGWVLELRHVSDYLALLQHHGIPHRVTEGATPRDG